MSSSAVSLSADRDNVQRRRRTAWSRERTAEIKSKPVEQRSAEETELLEKLESSRQAKNKRLSTFRLKRKEEKDRILAIDPLERTESEKAFLTKILDCRKRASEYERMRRKRKRMKASAEATTTKRTDDGTSRIPSAAAADGTNDDDGCDNEGEFLVYEDKSDDDNDAGAGNLDTPPPTPPPPTSHWLRIARYFM